MTVYVNFEPWDRLGVPTYKLWSDVDDAEALLAAYACGSGPDAFFPSNPHPTEGHRLFRHFMITGPQRDTAILLGAVATDKWGVMEFVAMRTLRRETDPALLTWASDWLIRIAQLRLQGAQG